MRIPDDSMSLTSCSILLEMNQTDEGKSDNQAALIAIFDIWLLYQSVSPSMFG